MLSTAFGLGLEEVLCGILRHVNGFIAITDTSRIGSLPVRVPVGTSTGIIERPHAVIVVPREVLGAALVEGGEEPGRGVLLHPGGLSAVVEASRLPSVGGLVGVEKLDARMGRGGLGRGA